MGWLSSICWFDLYTVYLVYHTCKLEIYCEQYELERRKSKDTRAFNDAMVACKAWAGGGILVEDGGGDA